MVLAVSWQSMKTRLKKFCTLQTTSSGKNRMQKTFQSRLIISQLKCMLNICRAIAVVQGETTSSLKMRQAQCPLVFDTAAQTTRLMKFRKKSKRKSVFGFQKNYLVSVTWQVTEGFSWQLKIEESLRGKGWYRKAKKSIRDRFIFYLSIILPEASVISSMGGIPFVNFSGKVQYFLFSLD